MNRDMVRRLRGFDLSESAVSSYSLSSARAQWRSVRRSVGLVGCPRVTTEPTGSAKAEHGLSDVAPAAVWMLYLLPADSSRTDLGFWQVLDGTVSESSYWFLLFGGIQTCRYASPGCRSACLAESGQQGMETRGGRKATGHIFRGRLARTLFLWENPVAFWRLVMHETDAAAVSKWAEKGFALGFRPNGTSDIPFESLGLSWLFERMQANGVQPYDYTAWPTSRRSRVAPLYIVDSVKETHTDRQIDAMARPVVVFDVKRGAPLPAVWRGRPIVDADLSDARWMDAEGTVRGLRYKHVSSTTKASAVAGGFVKVCA